jgi:hypothetical protein
MTGITTYLPILTLKVNGLNSPIKRHQLENWIKKEIQQSASYCRPTSSTEISTGWECKAGRDLPSQWPPKTVRGSNTYLGQSRLQTYIDQMR